MIGIDELRFLCVSSDFLCDFRIVERRSIIPLLLSIILKDSVRSRDFGFRIRGLVVGNRDIPNRKAGVIEERRFSSYPVLAWRTKG